MPHEPVIYKFEDHLSHSVSWASYVWEPHVSYTLVSYPQSRDTRTLSNSPQFHFAVAGQSWFRYNHRCRHLFFRSMVIQYASIGCMER